MRNWIVRNLNFEAHEWMHLGCEKGGLKKKKLYKFVGKKKFMESY